MKTVLFACTHNAGRSQMAAAFFNRIADPTKAVGISAGTHPATQVHPVVVTVMQEVGLDLRKHQPQRLSDAVARSADLLVTMGCGEACPYVPGLDVRDWALTDPKDRPLDEVRVIRDDIRSRAEALVHELGVDVQHQC